MKWTWQWLVAGLAVVSLASAAPATVLRVPSEYPTIQEGIDAALEGDTVLVADGTYTGDGNRDLDFGGVNMVVMSENGPEVTIIDCEGTISEPHRGFYFHSGEDLSSVLQGFTIMNGYTPGEGGGIDCEGASPTIKGNAIVGCHAGNEGGGIGCWDQASPTIAWNTIEACSAAYKAGGIGCEWGAPTIEGNTIVECYAGGYGGGIDCEGSPLPNSPTIKGNAIVGCYAGNGGGIGCGAEAVIIEGNTIVECYAEGYGGGINCAATVAIVGNTIVGNTAGHDGGGVSVWYGSPTIVNCILWDDSPNEIVGTPVVTYSDIQGGWPGEGNIDEDPLFVTGPLGDYYLSQTLAGQSEQSLCVDAGDPDSAVPEGTTRTDVVCDAWPTDMGYHYWCVPVSEVAIDIKPGSYPNAINLASQGVVPVAILSSETFDATDVDPGTVELSGAEVAVRGHGNHYMAHVEEVNGDDLDDLVVQVETENLDPTQFQNGYAVLTGVTFGDIEFVGTDEITIVPE